MPTDTIALELARGETLSVIRIVDYLIQKADEAEASDIHIDPTDEALRVRMRVDGLLHDVCLLPKSIRSEIIARIKVLAGLRSDEHRMPQDGRFRHIVADVGHIDVRVSTAPTYHGENAVLRLLSGRAQHFTLEMLGFSLKDRNKILQTIKKRSGMILATGPTGSGKTTTLYTLIKMLNMPDIAIVTIEDPIEYAISGVEQIQVQPRTGLTFAQGLRTILRQDPDIIMVGEIRDAETASIAVNAALTGHLLLSTLHTNDAATTLPRLLDLGVEEYLAASTVTLCIGQRLVRRICGECKEAATLTRGVASSLSRLPIRRRLSKDDRFFRGHGCDRCGGSGYAGRVSINEVLVADDAIREAIASRRSAKELQSIAMARGMTGMLEDGVAKALLGVTTLEEVLRAGHE